MKILNWQLITLGESNEWYQNYKYKRWCSKSFEKRDYIFFPDTLLLKQQYRILRRSIRRKLGIEKGHVKETLKSVKDLFLWDIKYNTEYKKIFLKL